MMHRFGVVLGLALAACGAQADSVPSAGSTSAASVVSTAVAFTDIDFSACLSTPGRVPTGDACPGFAGLPLGDAIELCAGSGGELKAGTVPTVWSVDVDADGDSEYLFDVTQNFYCDGAPSALSCGSLGCPTFLYANQGDAWVSLGSLAEIDVIGVEVLAAPEGARYGTLRGGCLGERPCEELTYYTWNGSSYEPTSIDVRGHRVDIAPDGLWTLARDASVLAEPAADSEVLDTYPAGTEVIVIGEARDAPYRYVSPCNACSSGFVSTDALTSP